MSPLSSHYYFCLFVASTSTESDEIKAEIRATAAVVERLCDLETSFSDMLAYLLDLLTESNCDLFKAQFHLNDLFRTGEYSHCNTFDTLLGHLQVHQGHIDKFNIYYLKELVARFKTEELTKCIEEYETKMKKFLEDTTVLQFQQAVVSREEPTKPDQTKDLTIRVSKAFATNRTLKELALIGFGDCQKFLVRMHMKPGSVIISWFFHEAFSGMLEHLACENAAVLKDAGVVEVTVDVRVVLPSTLEEEVRT